MKKLLTILLLSGLFLAVTFAQNETFDASLGYDYTYNLYTGTAGDTIGSGDSTWTYTIEKLTDTKIFAYARLELDSTGGTGAPVTVLLQNKVFNSETFSNIDTVTWTVGTDTTIIFETTTSDIADKWRILMTGSTDGFRAKVPRLDMKFIKP